MKSTTQNKTVINLWITFPLKTSWAVETFSERRQAKTTSESTNVLFIIHIDFKNIIHISFYILKSENTIYYAHTSVDLGMSSMGDAS